MGIKSSLSVAGNVSASFSQSANALNNIKGSTNIATRTNISGNAKAKETTTTFGQDIKQLATSIVAAGKNINSVAKDFSEIDLKASQQFQMNASPMSRWFK
ncbi:TIGR04197 family type VII secretion effector [Enterococcus ureasiticus]|uniref:TIGR04197 family type VII secretion effector n=1 Tax=Enterococcus ureasiticus TaxID=903984 RepID=UPI001A8D9F05|nr:TIGR04197 family type VII secretion effector [Enterococcus ureasiticus]MBO0472428.1 TIGR04197 family type VII secretion effector [Enterococcus ureasiticus]